ncbi:salicylate hydroxylase [Hypoxylon fragiforme]|uniref:salicylate hydroxylase n=1 Tax=Hypoxylon fragiforme TaxID=63214 RepID=UPI0020C6B51A|nr:salicylate hydroxylase [Hypoxylon fragiforme]KAI2605278.1 salicylate hydroxylase [Hypoxylon fragiforme]
MTSSIRVAIVGGGVAGASLLHALVKFPHLDVHIFESATEFKDAGMAFGLARNAQAALQLIGPSAVQCLERAGAVPMKGVRFMIAHGDAAGSLADETADAVPGKSLTSIVHRAPFLQELLADIPRDRMHASKKLEKVDQKNGPVTLYFTDGTTHECDILVGADGIHSTVRKLILGEDDAAAVPRNSGGWLLMTLQPFDKAQASLGQELVDIDNAREYSWIGQNAVLLHNILSNGEQVQFVIASNDTEVESAHLDHWQRNVGVDEIKKLFKDYPPPLNKAVDELLCNVPEHKALYLWEHPNARTYVSGPMCIMGDAAHSTTPWHGSGGGMSVEDSFILSTLLGRARTPSEALTALKAYDRVRRPRTQRIVESSRATGEMLMGRHAETGLDPKKFRSFCARWDFIIEIDMEKHRDEALQIMEAGLKGEDTIL